MKKIFSIFAITLFLTACTGTDKFVLRGSIGTLNKILVVTKSSNWTEDLGKEIRNSFGELMVGLPQPEPRLSVSQIAPNGFGSMMKISRNVLIIGASNKEEFYIKKNVFAQPQTIVYVYGKNDASVQEQFKKHKKEIIDAFIASDISMTQHRFKKEQLDNSQFKTLKNIDVSFIIPKSFK
ncbi:MAG: DUF4837 family protein, partial [Polaribacter sp.]